MDTIAENNTIAVPQPGDLSLREKEDAMGAYLMMFAAWGAGLPLPLIGLIASVIYFYVNKKSSRFTAFHALQALLTHLPISILNAAVVIWGVLFFIIPEWHVSRYYGAFAIFCAIWNILYMIFSIIACVQAHKGRFYYFWVFGRLAFTTYFRPSRNTRIREERNLAPEGL
jgi:uncharacterized membrane protein